MQHGGLLDLLVESATGLTPPPGLQEERAHRSFAVRLCATGISFGAPAECCFPVRVRNVRPLDGASLRYRVEAAVPSWVAPGSYRLLVRFPGGEASLDPGVQVMGANGALPPDLLRVHVGPRGISTEGAAMELYPLPAQEGGFAPGLVALVAHADGAQLHLRPATRPPPPFAIAEARALSGRPTSLRVTGTLAKGRVFWWLGQERGAEGARVTTMLEVRGEARVQALLITPQGALARAERRIPTVPRHAFACSVRLADPRSGGPVRHGLVLTGLLAVALSRKLRRRHRQPVRE